MLVIVARFALVSVGFAFALLLAASPANADVLVLRDGSVRGGTVQGCSSAGCVLDGVPVRRTLIAWIGLASRPPVPAVQTATGDEVHARGGRVTTGTLVRVDATRVALAAAQFSRADVTWIHLGVVTVAATVAPSVTSTATRAPFTSSPSTRSMAGGGCFDRAGGTAGVGPPCVRGTYLAYDNVTTKPYGTPREEDMTAALSGRFSLWAVAPGQLEGDAHLSYQLKAVQIDPRAAQCVTTTEVVKPFSWDAKLTGRYFLQRDGTVFVSFRANPQLGPPYEPKVIDCLVSMPQQHGIINPTFAGRLVNGVYDLRRERPIGPDSKGQSYTVMHFERVP